MDGSSPTTKGDEEQTEGSDRKQKSSDETKETRGGEGREMS